MDVWREDVLTWVSAKKCPALCTAVVSLILGFPFSAKEGHVIVLPSAQNLSAAAFHARNFRNLVVVVVAWIVVAILMVSVEFISVISIHVTRNLNWGICPFDNLIFQVVRLPSIPRGRHCLERPICTVLFCPGQLLLVQPKALSRSAPLAVLHQEKQSFITI